MKSNLFTILRFILALFTVLAIIGKPYIPPKTLLIYPAATTASYIYGDDTGTKGSSYSWTDESKNEWRCVFKMSTSPCGLNFVWKDLRANSCHSAPEFPTCVSANSDEDGDGWGWENEQSCIMPTSIDASANNNSSPHLHESACIDSTRAGEISGLTNSLDFSAYDGMNIKVHYEGKAQYLRLYLRSYISNLNQEITSTSTDDGVGKFMSAFLRTEDLKAGNAYVSLSEFSVAEWWILDTNAPRAMAQPEFDKIVSVGIDHIEHGTHKMRIERIELVGERITTENFLLAILAFWSALLLAEASIRYYVLYKTSRAREAKIDDLNAHAQQLEQEKNLLKTQAITDALTGSYNRAGLKQHMQIWYGGEHLPQNFGILMIDIDHFKLINDSHGHDTGDRILKALAQLIESNIREGDIFARWGGEEFILIARHAAVENLTLIAEKIRLLIAEHTFDSNLALKVTVSIGVASVQKGDTFINTLKRADTALYQAKINRNSVAFAE